MHMTNFFSSFFPFFSLLIAVFPLLVGIYFLLQFLRVSRERNDLLHDILEELRKNGRT